MAGRTCQNVEVTHGHWLVGIVPIILTARNIVRTGSVLDQDAFDLAQIGGNLAFLSLSSAAKISLLLGLLRRSVVAGGLLRGTPQG